MKKYEITYHFKNGEIKTVMYEGESKMKILECLIDKRMILFGNNSCEIFVNPDYICFLEIFEIKEEK